MTQQLGFEISSSREMNAYVLTGIYTRMFTTAMICNSPNLETTQMSIHRKKTKLCCMYIYMNCHKIFKKLDIVLGIFY